MPDVAIAEALARNLHRSVSGAFEMKPVLPLWMKLAFTAWMLFWAPATVVIYGPQNFFWLCNLANFMILAVASYTATLILSFLLGVGAGFFIVPISAYLQNESPSSRRARFIAASNFLAFSAMLLAPVLFWILIGPLGATPSHLFVLSGLASILVGVYTLHLLRRGTLDAGT